MLLISLCLTFTSVIFLSLLTFLPPALQILCPIFNFFSVVSSEDFFSMMLLFKKEKIW